jgi:hypothetical protein
MIKSRPDVATTTLQASERYAGPGSIEESVNPMGIVCHRRHKVAVSAKC